MQNTKCAGNAGTIQLKLNTLVKHSDLCSNENATPLSVTFRRQEAVNQCAEEAELIFKFNTAFFIGKEELPFTECKGQLDLKFHNTLT